MKRFKSNVEYGIIGLGRFGFALATALAQSGKEVLVVDNTESKIKQIRSQVAEAFIVEQLDRESLESTGIQNCSTVIVCIGETIDTSILTTLTVISMGVPKVISKATSTDQGRVLEKLGAEVVYPERDIAERLARRLLSPHALDFFRLHGDISVSEVKLSKAMVGTSVKDSDIRRRFGLNIIAMEFGDVTNIEVSPDYVFGEGDIVVVIGKRSSIKEFEDFLAERDTEK